MFSRPDWTIPKAGVRPIIPPRIIIIDALVLLLIPLLFRTLPSLGLVGLSLLLFFLLPLPLFTSDGQLKGFSLRFRRDLYDFTVPAALSRSSKAACNLKMIRRRLARILFDGGRLNAFCLLLTECLDLLHGLAFEGSIFHPHLLSMKDVASMRSLNLRASRLRHIPQHVMMLLEADLHCLHGGSGNAATMPLGGECSAL